MDRLARWLEPFETCFGHVAQRDVPGRIAVRRELAGALMHVDVGVDDQEVPKGSAAGHVP